MRNNVKSGKIALASDPPPSGLKRLWVMPHAELKPAEQVLAQTLQGLIAAKPDEAIWLRGRSMYAVVEEQLRREGVHIEVVPTIWLLLQAFQMQFKSTILYRLGTPSLNVATSLCGPLQAVAIDESLAEHAKSIGLPIMEDVRGMDEAQALAKYGDRFARGVLVEQSPDKPGHMRDFAVARKAFTFYTKDSAFRTRAARTLGPNAIVYGWGERRVPVGPGYQPGERDGRTGGLVYQPVRSPAPSRRNAAPPAPPPAPRRGRRALPRLCDERRR